MSIVASAAKASFETLTVTSAQVACDGGGGPLGHPRVFLSIGHDRQVTCPYCSRTHVLAEGARVGGGH